jgi:bifunctional UDP-N-acetylglucosamine pyrophosphorylase/glucosamine-1-phosphate N-acetyltransferase
MSAVVLAAGQGTRMRSRTHKVLHEVAGKPLLLYALDLAAEVGARNPVVVLGHLPEQVRAVLPTQVRTVVQEPQLGTGHAVQVAADLLQRDASDRLLVLYGDTVLMWPHTLHRLSEQQVGPDAPVVLLTARFANPYGYGRVLRAEDGTVAGMVEEAEATEAQRAVDEVWSGVMLLWTPWLWDRLPRLPRRSKGEYYLPDLVNIAREEGRSVMAVLAQEEEEAHGVNDREQLAEANAILWRRKRTELMQAGVSILDPSTTYIEPEVEIAPDVVVRPGCHLRGNTRIATGCDIGPDTEIVDSQIGEGSRVWRSVVEGAQVGRHVSVGPFSHLRPGAVVEDDVELGNFAEVKASRLGTGSKMHHFSYVGDAEIGKRVNIGAGTITCNFDGQRKHRTIVGDDSFIGSDTMLVAPVEVGDGAGTGAGSVVTHDVPPGEVWAGVPARPLKHRTAPDTASGPARGRESQDER